MATSHHTPIDGSDWDTSEESPTYRRHDRQDACERAVEWRLSQSPYLATTNPIDYELVPPTAANDAGWLHIGNTIEWDKSRLRILWDPATNRVQVERPKPRDTIIELPPPEPLPPKPIQFTFTLKRSPSCPTIAVRLRLYSTGDREDLIFPVISMQVPPPSDASRLQWEWTTRLAESRMNVIELPDAFLETPASERMLMFREAIYARLQQIQEDGGRRH